MKLVAQGGNMVVDFYPVQFATGEIHNRLMLKTVTFDGGQVSKRYINKKDMVQEINSRVHGYGYEVTDFHTTPQLFNSGLAVSC